MHSLVLKRVHKERLQVILPTLELKINLKDPK